MQIIRSRHDHALQQPVHVHVWRIKIPTMLSLLSCVVIAFVPFWTTVMTPSAIQEHANASLANDYSPHHLTAPDVHQHPARPRRSLSIATHLDAAGVLPYDTVYAASAEDAAADVPLRVALISCYESTTDMHKYCCESYPTMSISSNVISLDYSYVSQSATTSATTHTSPSTPHTSRPTPRVMMHAAAQLSTGCSSYSDACTCSTPSCRQQPQLTSHMPSLGELSRTTTRSSRSPTARPRTRTLDDLVITYDQSMLPLDLYYECRESCPLKLQPTTLALIYSSSLLISPSCTVVRLSPSTYVASTVISHAASHDTVPITTVSQYHGLWLTEFVLQTMLVPMYSFTLLERARLALIFTLLISPSCNVVYPLPSHITSMVMPHVASHDTALITTVCEYHEPCLTDFFLTELILHDKLVYTHSFMLTIPTSSYPYYSHAIVSVLRSYVYDVVTILIKLHTYTNESCLMVLSPITTSYLSSPMLPASTLMTHVVAHAVTPLTTGIPPLPDMCAYSAANCHLGQLPNTPSPAETSEKLDCGSFSSARRHAHTDAGSVPPSTSDVRSCRRDCCSPEPQQPNPVSRFADRTPAAQLEPTVISTDWCHDYFTIDASRRHYPTADRALCTPRVLTNRSRSDSSLLQRFPDRASDASSDPSSPATLTTWGFSRLHGITPLRANESRRCVLLQMNLLQIWPPLPPFTAGSVSISSYSTCVNFPPLLHLRAKAIELFTRLHRVMRPSLPHGLLLRPVHVANPVFRSLSCSRRCITPSRKPNCTDYYRCRTVLSTCRDHDLL